MGKPMTQKEQDLEFELSVISGENTLLRRRNKALVEILDQIQTNLAELQNSEDFTDTGCSQTTRFYNQMCANVTNYESLKP